MPEPAPATTPPTALGAHSDAAYPGIVIETSAQYGQEIALRYANTPPTNRDVQRMALLLRRTADDLARGLP